MTRRKAFFVMEAVLGLVLLVVLATALVVVANRHGRVSSRLAATRAAARSAEQALVAMQSGQRPAQAVSVKPVTFDSQVKNMTWVQVTAENDGQRATLFGLVPEGAVPVEAGR